MIRRRIAIFLLSLGTVAGFAMGFHSMRHYHCQSHRESFEDHVADVCVRAAKNADQKARHHDADRWSPDETNDR